MEEEELLPFTLTLVHYRRGDFVGLVLSACTLAPIFLVVSYVTLLVSHRFPLRLCFVFAGQLGNVALNVLLKHVLRMPRPQKPHLVYFGQYGMPSNHSQFMFFLVGFFFSAWMRKQVPREVIPMNQHLFGVIVIGLATSVAVSRVYLEYHSVDQVAVGALVGFFVGVVWHALLGVLDVHLTKLDKAIQHRLVHMAIESSRSKQD